MYSLIEDVQINEPLHQAVYAAFTARKSLVMARSSKRAINHKSILRQCDVAGKLLEESLSFNNCKQPTTLLLVSLSIIHSVFFQNFERVLLMCIVVALHVILTCAMFLPCNIEVCDLINFNSIIFASSIEELKTFMEIVYEKKMRLRNFRLQMIVAQSFKQKKD